MSQLSQEAQVSQVTAVSQLVQYKRVSQTADVTHHWSQLVERSHPEKYSRRTQLLATDGSRGKVARIFLKNDTQANIIDES